MKDTRLNNDLRGSVRYKPKILELYFQCLLFHFNWHLNSIQQYTFWSKSSQWMFYINKNNGPHP